MIESGGETAVFAADLIPTTAHVDEPWIMGYDLYPMDTLAFKRTFVREAIEREYLIFFEHDPDDRRRLHPRGERPEARRARCLTQRSTPSESSIQHSTLSIQHFSMITIGIIGGSGLYDMAELTDREERTRRDAVRRAVGAVRHRHAARQAGRVSRAARRRPPAAAVGAELPRQHLRLQDARRRVHPVGERRRQPEGGVQAAGSGDPGPVLRPHARPDLDVLRPRPGRRTSASRIRSARR